jgi:hypothetical protein
MDYNEKIKLLIDAPSPENNYLALQLLMNLLHYSFEEAYAKLKPENQDDELVRLAIANIHIVYKVDLQRIIYAPSSYADIVRNVIFRGEVLPDFSKKLYADDDSILGLGELGTVEELQEIKDDIAALCGLVKQLWGSAD